MRGLIVASAFVIPVSITAQEVSPPEQRTITLTRGELAVIREVRNIALVAGENQVSVHGVSPQIDPTTVHVRALTSPRSLRLIDQQPWYEPLNTENILESLIGRDISITHVSGEQTELIEGQLLLPIRVPSPTGQERIPLFVETPEGQIRVLENGDLTLDSLPSGDWNRVRLDWILEAATEGRYRFELVYLSEGLWFEPRYSLRLDTDGKADFLGMATLLNETGGDFSASSLQLSDPALLQHRDKIVIPRDIQLPARGNQQVSFVQGHDLETLRTATVFSPSLATRTEAQSSARERIDLVNTDLAGLGRLILSGPVHLYTIDETGKPEQLIESRIAMTYPGEILTIPGAPLSEIVVHRQLLSKDSTTITVNLRITNSKSEPIELEVFQALDYGEFVRDERAVTDPRRPRTATFALTVRANQQVKLQYDITTP